MKYLLLFFLSVFSLSCYAQSVGINTAGKTGDPSSMLDVSSNTKGILIPRLSTAQITAIPNPAKALLVYDSVLNRFMVNTGTKTSPSWQPIAGSGSGWSLNGNAGTDTAVNFIGTTDAQPLLFRVNNQPAGIIDIQNSNTAIGAISFQDNTSGSYNTAFGRAAMNRNTEGYGNTAVGEEALRGTTTGNSNTAVGASALSNSPTGTQNTAVGADANAFNSAGTDNTAVGFSSMPYNYADYNTAIGANALSSNANGTENVGLGYQALLNNYSGGSNTGVGNGALYYSLANLNTAIGHNALYNTTNGGGNTALGADAGIAQTTGIQCTYLGYRAGVTAAAVYTNSTAVGFNSIITASNMVQLGNTSTTLVNTAGGIKVHNTYGMIRNSSGTQLKEVELTVTVDQLVPEYGSVQIAFTFPEAFSAAPSVMVGNVVGGGGFAEMAYSVAGVSTTGGTLFVYNARPTSLGTNFDIKLIAIGAE